MLGSDDCDRVMRDLKKLLDEMPHPALGVLLEVWMGRVNNIRSQLSFVGNPDCPAQRELQTYERVITELQAAVDAMNDNPVNVLRTLLESKHYAK